MAPAVPPYSGIISFKFDHHEYEIPSFDLTRVDRLHPSDLTSLLNSGRSRPPSNLANNKAFINTAYTKVLNLAVMNGAVPISHQRRCMDAFTSHPFWGPPQVARQPLPGLQTASRTNATTTVPPQGPSGRPPPTGPSGKTRTTLVNPTIGPSNSKRPASRAGHRDQSPSSPLREDVMIKGASLTPRDPKVGASEREVSLHQIPHHAERNHHQHFVLPPKEELPITEVTVGKFLDLFCTANPSVSPIVNPPWEEIIKVFKQYVMTYYEHEPGKVKHISQALSRTKHQIPQDLVAKETRQLLTNVDKVKVEKVQATSTNESLAMVSSDPRKRLREEAHDSPYHINKHVRTEGPSNTVSERMDLDSPKLEDDTASAWVSASSDKGVAAGSLSRPSNGTDVVASRGIRLYSPSNPTFPPLALIGGTTANGADSGMITDKLNGGRGGAQSPTMGSQTRATLPGLTGVNATVELRPSSISGIGTRGTSAPTIAALASNGHSVPVASTPNGVGNHVGIGAVQTPNPQSALLQSVESHISRVETSIKTSLSYLEKVKLGLGSNGDSDASPNLVVVEYLQQGALTEIKKLKRVLQKQAS